MQILDVSIIMPYISKEQIDTLRSNKQGGASFDITVPTLVNYYLPQYQIVFTDPADPDSGFISFPKY